MRTGRFLRRSRRAARRLAAVVTVALLLVVLIRPAAQAAFDEVGARAFAAQTAELERSLGGAAPEQPEAVEARLAFDKKRFDAGLACFGFTVSLLAAPGSGKARPFDDGLIRPPPRAVAAQFATGPPQARS